METQIQTQTLRDRIAAARALSLKDEAEQERRRVRDHQNTLERLIRETLEAEDELIFTMNGCRVEAEIDGLVFCFHASDYGPQLMLVLKCSNCHKDEDLYAGSLDAVARSIEGGLTAYHANGHCLGSASGTTAPQTTEERLLEALRDYIAEHGYQG